MKFWTYSTKVLATLLAVVSITHASGPTDGDAVADPNSAVVKLTSENFASFIEENPLILAEFFAHGVVTVKCWDQNILKLLIP